MANQLKAKHAIITTSNNNLAYLDAWQWCDMSYSGFLPLLWTVASVCPPHAATAIWPESDKYSFI